MHIFYVAGKITGDSTAAEKFQSAVACVQSAWPDAVMLNPMILPSGMTPADYMQICFAMIQRADTVVMLPDWTNSAGATLEYMYAKYVGKHIVYLHDSEFMDEV